MGLQVLKVDELQSRYVRGVKIHLRSHARVQGLLPAGCAEAPLVTWHQSGKSELWHGGREVVARDCGKLKELLRCHDAHCVDAVVSRSRAAVTVSIETSHGFEATGLQWFAFYILRHVHMVGESS